MLEIACLFLHFCKIIIKCLNFQSMYHCVCMCVYTQKLVEKNIKINYFRDTLAVILSLLSYKI